jgi:hypothetical protein
MSGLPESGRGGEARTSVDMLRERGKPKAPKPKAR